MSEHLETEIVVGGVITYAGEVLLARKEEGDHPVSGEWHFPGGHIEEDEQPEEALKREIAEEADIDIEIHHVVDSYILENDELRIVYHCEAHSKDAEPSDDIDEVEWVDPSKLLEKLEGTVEQRDIERRPRLANLIEKLEKMPSMTG